jgi:hypothetical protein
MDGDLPEKDWKAIRRLHAEALERFCRRVLEHAARIAGSAGQSAHARYLELYKLVEEQDKEIEWIFNDLRRSNAVERLCAMCSRRLLSQEELACLSPETLERVRWFTEEPFTDGGERADVQGQQ